MEGKAPHANACGNQMAAWAVGKPPLCGVDAGSGFGFEDGSGSSGDDAVFGGFDAADADGAVHHEGQAAFDRDDAAERERGVAAAADHVFEDFGGAFEIQGGLRFFLRDDDAAELRAVRAGEVEQVAAIVDDGDDHGPFVFHGLGFGLGGDFLRELVGERGLRGELRAKRPREDRESGEGADEGEKETRLRSYGAMARRGGGGRGDGGRLA